MNQSLNDRFGVLPLVATILPGIVAILTINILEDSAEVRLLISFFLVFIPLILWLYLRELRDKHGQSKRILIKIFQEAGDSETPKQMPEISVAVLGVGCIYYLPACRGITRASISFHFRNSSSRKFQLIPLRATSCFTQKPKDLFEVQLFSEFLHFCFKHGVFFKSNTFFKYSFCSLPCFLNQGKVG